MVLSVKIMLYNFFVSIFVPFVLEPANQIRFGITPDQKTALNDAFPDFTGKFSLYVNPKTHTSPVINDANTSYAICFKLTESVRKQIKANFTVKLNGMERLILGIPAPSNYRDHVSVPDIEPVVVCIFKSSLFMRFVAFDPTNPFRRAKPKDVFSIGIKIAITEAGAPPPLPADYENQNPENNTEFEMLFTTPQIGKTLYIICYYMNNRNEAGRDGRPSIVTII